MLADTALTGSKCVGEAGTIWPAMRSDRYSALLRSLLKVKDQERAALHCVRGVSRRPLRSDSPLRALAGIRAVALIAIATSPSVVLRSSGPHHVRAQGRDGDKCRLQASHNVRDQKTADEHPCHKYCVRFISPLAPTCRAHASEGDGLVIFGLFNVVRSYHTWATCLHHSPLCQVQVQFRVGDVPVTRAPVYKKQT
jgi:hypothetical protein